ncbi:hypothetical protein PBRA_000621 [Plasmodiophora brassicae]|uniref:Protein kinase domain-containing protein n=1 Tax=Plasmodiophora brassicae TaxID=37360 RepID=A0A0G4IQ47_PLABS|nr:hypothetical protein PBRA_000621 [Plasmodiophora brassicae]
MYDDMMELVENHTYLTAARSKRPDNLMDALPPFDTLSAYVQELRDTGQLTFDAVFHEPIGYYQMKCFLISDYSVSKAVFATDVELYKLIRDQRARLRLAHLIFKRYIADCSEGAHNQVMSVFETERRKRSLRRPGTLPTPTSNATSAGYAAPSVRIVPHVSAGPGDDAGAHFLTLQIGQTNVIGVHGRSVKAIETMLNNDMAPASLFDAAFLESVFFEKYIRAKSCERRDVTIADFTMLRMLGHGAFGAVNACVKNDTGKMYAAKCIDKRRVMGSNYVHGIMAERDALVSMDSPFVCCLNYAVEDDNDLILILDVMMGGDLKYHLVREGRFPEVRARYHAAQVLLGLEHIHSKDIIFRDMKLENVLLDEMGHCKISDLGLAIRTTRQVRGYAGTPGYTAPEVVAGHYYDRTADWFSFGVLIYRMLTGEAPFAAVDGEDADAAVLHRPADLSSSDLTDEARSLLAGLLEKSPMNRLGHKGATDIKMHPWFDPIDWGLLESGNLPPPFIPAPNEVYAENMVGVDGPDADQQFKDLVLTAEFQASLRGFPYQSNRAIQKEIVEVLVWNDRDTNYEKFAAQAAPAASTDSQSTACGTCTIL